MRHVAIIGSGPAGCYLAEQLLRAAEDVCVDIIERLPVPFGLVRYGVAPDHQGTKAIARLLDRALARDRVQFFGHVEVGADVQLDELSSFYDAVVLATGAPRDRTLGVDGETLPGVIGSGAFVRWYNDHPDRVLPALQDVHSAVVIGNGNVAIDVVRLLTKTSRERVGSDLAPMVCGVLDGQPLESVHVVGRRGPEHAKFTQPELAELGELEQARPRIVDPDTLLRAGEQGASGPILNLFDTFASNDRQAPVSIDFHFGMRPVHFAGDQRVEAVHFACEDGSNTVVPAQLVVKCIGYESVACCTRRPDGGVFANDNARIDAGLYVTGWAARGPSGTIPTNRKEAKKVAKRIAEEVVAHERQGADALRELLAQREVRTVDHTAWQQIDAAEKSRAPADRCRLKFDSVEAMFGALGS